MLVRDEISFCELNIAVKVMLDLKLIKELQGYLFCIQPNTSTANTHVQASLVDKPHPSFARTQGDHCNIVKAK